MSTPEQDHSETEAEAEAEADAKADASGDGAPALRSWQHLARIQVAAARWWAGQVALRRVINLMFAGLLMAVMVFSTIHTDALPESMKPKREQLGGYMHTLSLSQRWQMYAPDPTRGHAYPELIAYDAQGNARVLPESRLVEEGWGTWWAWERNRRQLWEHIIVRKIDKVNRHRIWYLRGLCMREARLGHAVERVELRRVYRRVRPPEKVLKGDALLGPPKIRKGRDTSCKVKIIREMIAADPMGAGAALAAAQAAEEAGQ
ncbi:hypothetical protein G6O69_23695 [Pseudenhygromyxa sp. WMMC2535]|uniref:hypothetical protein n=1 Tax=Pseudenhygromyxa sp. WMMC2535 TaxID=2712867 RepID=UPI00155576BF|nr:hypothetical protein [Pseudenhygromyxa sp. WMMC2535]NVB40863.1 hypothetical protein [Pseudenhygromyxa sp. WMMC2535]